MRQRWEDGIAEHAQVVVHVIRDTLTWSATGCGVGVGGEGALNLSEVLARRFERHGPRVDRDGSGLQDEKMTRCNASPVPSMVRSTMSGRPHQQNDTLLAVADHFWVL
jgi:hypothetical protein